MCALRSMTCSKIRNSEDDKTGSYRDGLDRRYLAVFTEREYISWRSNYCPFAVIIVGKASRLRYASFFLGYVPHAPKLTHEQSAQRSTCESHEEKQTSCHTRRSFILTFISYHSIDRLLCHDNCQKCIEI